MENQFIELNEKPILQRKRNFLLISLVCSIVSIASFSGILISLFFLSESNLAISLVVMLSAIFLYFIIAIISGWNMKKGINLYRVLAFENNQVSGLVLAIAITIFVGTLVFPAINIVSIILVTIVLSKGEDY